MALVGAPVAHEDHARRALLAALGIRRRLEQEPLARDADGEPLAVRMGINSGMVVLGNLGDGVALDFTAIGDAINVAARLEAAAAPGEILISEATAHMVSGYVRTEPLGPMDLRGKEVPSSRTGSSATAAAAPPPGDRRGGAQPSWAGSASSAL